jgi:hypothetical protein
MEEPTPEPTLAMVFRIVSVERDILALKNQVNLSVPLKENDLNFQIIRNIIERMESEVEKAKNQLEIVMTKQIEQGSQAQAQLAAEKESQAALQIKVLWGAISIIIGFVMSILIAYITHLFH